MVAMLELTQYALTYPDNENQLPEDFNEELLSDWIDDLPDKDLERLLGALMGSVKKFSDAIPQEFKDQASMQTQTPTT